MSDNEFASPIPKNIPVILNKFKCEYTFYNAFTFICVWLIIATFTLGIGLFFAIYYFYTIIISKTYLVDEDGEVIGTLDCKITFTEILEHIIIWILITIFTLGIGYFFYLFYTVRLCINKTVIIQP